MNLTTRRQAIGNPWVLPRRWPGSLSSQGERPAVAVSPLGKSVGVFRYLGGGRFDGNQ